MSNESIEQNIDKEAKLKMQEALADYKKDQNSVKEFYPCTQELSKWLEAEAK